MLAGEDMVVCGSEQRKHTVIDLVDKINFLKPKSHPNHEVVLWSKAHEELVFVLLLVVTFFYNFYEPLYNV